MFYSMTFKGYFSSKKINSNSPDHFKNLSLLFEEDLIKIDFKVSKLPREILNEAKNFYQTQIMLIFNYSR